MRQFFLDKLERTKERNKLLDELNNFFKEKYLKGEIDFQCKVRIPVFGEAESKNSSDLWLKDRSIEFESIGYMNDINIEIFSEIIIEHFLKDKLFMRKLHFLKIKYLTYLYNTKWTAKVVELFIN